MVALKAFVEYVLQQQYTAMKLLIYGIGSFADYIAYSIDQESNYDIVAHCVEARYLTNDAMSYKQRPLVDFESIDKIFDPEDTALMIAVGNNVVRERLYNDGLLKGYRMASYVSSRADVASGIELGHHVIITEQSLVHPFVSIGDNVIVLSSTIGHHSVIGNHVLMSKCTVGGSAKVGNRTFIGMNAAIKHGVSIENDNIIGMGSIITKNTKFNEVYSSTSTQRRNVSADSIIDRYL